MKATRQQLKAMVSGTYQLQRLRVGIGNRIVGNFKAKLGQLPGESEDSIEDNEKKVLDTLREHYKKLTDGVVRFPRQKNFVGTEIISSYTELCLLEQYFSLEKAEIEHFKLVENILKDFPIYTDFLKSVKGVGRAIAGVIISEIDIEKATYPSSLRKYAGVDVAWTGEGRSRRKAHLEMRPYIARDGSTKLKKSITFNPTLKTQLMGILASSFIKCGGPDSPYRKIYYDYKERISNSPMHRDNYLAIKMQAPFYANFAKPKIITRAQKEELHNAIERSIDVPDDIDPSNIEDYIKSMTRDLRNDFLGKHQIVEDIVEQGYAIGPFYHLEELEEAVKAAGGTLRKPKYKEVIKEDDEMTEDDVSRFSEIEEIDTTPDKRNRELYRLVNVGKTARHRDWMSRRRMIRHFLLDLYNAWRAIEGLPIALDYPEAKLGIVHGEVKPVIFESKALRHLKKHVFTLGSFTFGELKNSVNNEVIEISDKVIDLYLKDLLRMQLLSMDENGAYTISI